MNSRPVKRNWRWPMLTSSLVLLVFMAVLIDERVGPALGLLPLNPPFFDWLAILAAGDAHRAGADVYATPNPFDPFGRPHSYGPWWLVLGNLGFSVGDRWWMGALISSSFVLVATAVLAPRTPAGAALAVAILISPPVMLGMERGNNDLVVFLMLAGAGWTGARCARGGVGGAAAVVCLAAALKIYPLVALTGLPAVRQRRPTILAAGAASIGVCVIVAWWYRSDYVRALAVVPKEVSAFTYGFEVFAALSGNLWKQQWSTGVGIAAGLGVALSLLGSRLRALWRLVPLHGGTAFAYVSGAACWTFCYFAVTNLPYRAVLLLLPARLWLGEWHDRDTGSVSRRCFALVLVLLWMACVTGNLDGWNQRNPGKALMALWGTVVGFEQTLAFAVTMALFVSLAGWAMRHWRAGFPNVAAG